MIRVIIADDSAFMRRALKMILEKDPEITVIALAKNGLEAVELVKKLDPDVLTLDIEMPELNGIEALKRIINEHPIPVIMISSLTTAGAKETIQALEIGAVDYISKDIDHTKLNVLKIENEIINKIKSIARRKHIIKSRLLRKNIQQRHILEERNFLDDEYKNLILAGLDKIFFSFDSYNKNDYEKNRKGSDYDKTLSNIINFLQIKKKLKAKKPAAILLLMDLAILNKDSKNLNSKYKKTKIFNSIKRNINANISADRNINIDSNICSNIDSNINNIDRNIDNNININIEANIDSNIYKNNKFEFLKNFKGLPLDKIIFRKPHNWAGNLNLPLNTKPVNIMKCTFLWYSLTILFNGDVVLCPQDFQGKLLVGNLKTQSIREVFNNNTMQNFREKFSKKNIKCLIPCNNCDRILRKTFASIPLEFLKNKRI